ncbi:MAG: F0F1 ATP synthase subunit B [Nitrospirae bacterium]|nr:F0F1 ATP synthase subunit B [Nitrospirota bacterium]
MSVRKSQYRIFGIRKTVFRLRRVVSPLISAAVVLVFLFSHAAVALAMEGAGEGGGDWKDWLWKVLNFAILLFILVKFLNKPMKEYFRQRTELIEKSLAEAREAKELAQKALHEVEEKLKLKDQEIERIISSAKQSGQAEHDSLVEQGREMSEKIRQQARTNIEMELKNAKAALRAEASGLALRLAEKRLRERLTEEEQLKLLEESIKRLEG